MFEILQSFIDWCSNYNRAIIFIVVILLYKVCVQRSQQQYSDDEGYPDQVKTEEEWEKLLDNRDKIIVCDFYATWCPPCRVAAPHYKRVAEDPQYTNKVIFRKCNVDKASAISRRCKVYSMPTFKIYYNNNEIYKMSGFKEETLRYYINQILTNHPVNSM